MKVCELSFYLLFLSFFFRNFSINVETHQTLFHPNFHMVVVEGGKQEVKQANTKGFVIGYIEGERIELH